MGFYIGFRLSMFSLRKSTYSRVFRTWGYKRRTKGADWRWVATRSQQRSSEGRESRLYIQGVEVPQETVKRRVSRHVLPTDQVLLNNGTGKDFIVGLQLLNTF